MSLHNDNPAAQVFMTCGELIHQEEQYIREYAAHYDIPTNLKRGEMLERICALHTGSEPAIPLLNHFAFDATSDGRIHITGHKEPTGSSTQTNKTLHSFPTSDCPPTRRLIREHAQIIPLNEPSAPEPIAQTVESTEAQKSIIPEEMYPTKRFPTPSDTYSPIPSRASSPAPCSRREVSSAPLTKPRMEFVYPPKPRARGSLQQGDNDAVGHEDHNERAFSPGPPWLEKMLVDLELGRKDLLGDLDEVKREAQDALYEVIRVHILVEKEQAQTKALVDRMRRIVGDDVVDAIIAEGTQAAEERTSDEEEGSEDGGEQELDSEEDGRDQHGTDGSKKFSEQSSYNKESSKDEPAAHVTPGFFERQPTAGYLDGNVLCRSKRTFEAFSDGEADEEDVADDESSPRRPVAGPSHKRLRTSPPPPPPKKIHKPLSPKSVLIAENLSATLLSRKRSRDDEEEESEQEVEKSIRESVSVESTPERLLNGNKRFRPDDGGAATEARNRVPMLNLGLSLVAHESLEGSNSQLSTSDDSGSDADTSGEDAVSFNDYIALEDHDDSSYVSSEDDEEYDALEFDVAEDEILVDVSTSGDEDSESDGHSNTEHNPQKSLHFLVDDDGKGNWMWDAPTPSVDIEDYLRYVKGLEDEPPLHESHAIDAPSEPLQVLGRNRPLTRTRERLRPTSAGGVEVYKYDEGLEYEARLAREAQVVAEWRKFETKSSGHRTRESLRETKGRRFADGEVEGI